MLCMIFLYILRENAEWENVLNVDVDADAAADQRRHGHERGTPRALYCSRAN